MENIHRNMGKLFWVNLFNNFFWLSAVVTFFYLQRGLNYTEILSLSAVMGISIILFEVPTGLFADKYGRKNSLILSNILFLFSMSLYLIANTFLMFVIIFFILGIGKTFSSGATEALVYDSLRSIKKESKMKGSMGKFISAEVLAGVITPPIASFIAKDLLPKQFDILIYLTLASYFLALLISLFIRDIRLNFDLEVKSSFFNNLRILRNNRKLLLFIFNKTFVTTAMLSYMFLWQPQFQVANVPIKLFGVFLGLGCIGIFFVNRNIEFLSNTFGTRVSLVSSSLLPALGFIALAFIFNPVISIILYLLIRITASVREPIFSELVNKELPSSTRASLLSVISMISAIFALVLRPLIGVITDIGLQWGFISLGILCLISTFLFPIKFHDV